MVSLKYKGAQPPPSFQSGGGGGGGGGIIRYNNSICSLEMQGSMVCYEACAKHKNRCIS